MKLEVAFCGRCGRAWILQIPAGHDCAGDGVSKEVNLLWLAQCAYDLMMGCNAAGRLAWGTAPPDGNYDATGAYWFARMALRHVLREIVPGESHVLADKVLDELDESGEDVRHCVMWVLRDATHVARFNLYLDRDNANDYGWQVFIGDDVEDAGAESDLAAEDADEWGVLADRVLTTNGWRRLTPWRTESYDGVAVAAVTRCW